MRRGDRNERIRRVKCIRKTSELVCARVEIKMRAWLRTGVRVVEFDLLKSYNLIRNNSCPLCQRLLSSRRYSVGGASAQFRLRPWLDLRGMGMAPWGRDGTPGGRFSSSGSCSLRFSGRSLSRPAGVVGTSQSSVGGTTQRSERRSKTSMAGQRCSRG